jgi:hypothetical protein
LVTLATRPDISEEILANCGVLVTFKTHMEKGFLGRLLNLDNENENYLSILEEGQAIIRINSLKKPFLLSVPLIKRKSLLLSDIRQRNRSILNKGAHMSAKNSKKNIEQNISLNDGVEKNSEKEKVKTDYRELKSFIHDLFTSQEKNH